MALSVYEEIDVSSSGDNVDEGFTKCKNNWAQSDIATLGHYNRSQFTYVDGDTLTVGGGSYDVNGSLVKITSALTTTAHGITGADWGYLYIDYSSIPSDDVLIQSDLIWSTTEPTWSHTKHGWYNGNDRCIFAVLIAVTSDDIIKFNHRRNLITWDNELFNESTVTIPAAWTDIGNALTIPSFCTEALVNFRFSNSTGSQSVNWRTNGSAAANGHEIVYLKNGHQPNNSTVRVTTDSNKLIELDGVGGVGTYNLDETGWFLPEGM